MRRVVFELKEGTAGVVLQLLTVCGSLGVRNCGPPGSVRLTGPPALLELAGSLPNSLPLQLTLLYSPTSQTARISGTSARYILNGILFKWMSGLFSTSRVKYITLPTNVTPF